VRKERRKGGRRRTDKEPVKDAEVTLTNERSAGAVHHDERGEAHWAWATEQQSLDRTFDELKALDNDALRLLDSEPAPRRPRTDGGYNPYDATSSSNRKLKPRR
jgi:hypothetical protein